MATDGNAGCRRVATIGLVELEFALFNLRNGLELLLSLGLLLVKAFAFADAAVRPAAVFVAADKQTKTFWLIVLGLFLVAHVLFPRPIGILNLVGTVAALVYLADARPTMRALRGGSR